MTEILSERPELVFTPETDSQMFRFLEKLVSGLPERLQFCIQSLQEGVPDPRVKQIQFILGNDFPASALKKLNQQGYFTNVCLNVFGKDSSGVHKKSAKTVEFVRGHVVDIDSPVPLSLLGEAIKAFQPTMVVLSSAREEFSLDYDENSAEVLSSKGWFGKAHFYWIYQGLQEHQHVQLLRDYKDLQVWLALKVEEFLIQAIWGAPGEVKCDKQLIAPSIAMRIPGLYHQKNQKNVCLSTLWYDGGAYLQAPLVLDAEGKTLLREYRRKIRESAVGSVVNRPGNDLRTVGFDSGDVAAIEASLNTTAAPESLEDIDTTGLQSVYPGAVEGSRNDAMYQYVYRQLLIRRRFTKNEALGAAAIENVTMNVPPLAEQELVNVVESAWGHYLEWIEGGGPAKSAAREKAANKKKVNAREARDATIGEVTQAFDDSTVLHDAELSVTAVNPSTGEVAKKKLLGDPELTSVNSILLLNEKVPSQLIAEATSPTTALESPKKRGRKRKTKSSDESETGNSSTTTATRDGSLH